MDTMVFEKVAEYSPYLMHIYIYIYKLYEEDHIISIKKLYSVSLRYWGSSSISTNREHA